MLEIKVGGRYRLQGSDTEIEVVEYRPHAFVRYRNPDNPVDPNAPFTLTIDEFNKYASDPNAPADEVRLNPEQEQAKSTAEAQRAQRDDELARQESAAKLASEQAQRERDEPREQAQHQNESHRSGKHK